MIPINYCIPTGAGLAEEKPTRRDPDESDSAYERRIKPASVDICRFFLPAASLANVGVTINARALEYAICKMLSSPLEEVRQIGEWVLKVGKEEAPTLIKYAGYNAYLMKTTSKGCPWQAERVKLSPVHGERFRINQIMMLMARIRSWLPSSSAFHRKPPSRHACQSHVRQLDDAGRQALVQELMAERGPFDQPLREFEYAQMTFEAVMDQGAYFEFKRHRMMTQTVQPLTALLGYAVPRGNH